MKELKLGSLLKRTHKNLLELIDNGQLDVIKESLKEVEIINKETDKDEPVEILFIPARRRGNKINISLSSFFFLRKKLDDINTRNGYFKINTPLTPDEQDDVKNTTNNQEENERKKLIESFAYAKNMGFKDVILGSYNRRDEKVVLDNYINNIKIIPINIFNLYIHEIVNKKRLS